MMWALENVSPFANMAGFNIYMLNFGCVTFFFKGKDAQKRDPIFAVTTESMDMLGCPWKLVTS